MKINVQQKSQLGSVTLKELFTRPEYLKPTLIMFFIMVSRQMSGVNYVTFYLNEIFIKADTGFSSELQSTIVTAVAVSKEYKLACLTVLFHYEFDTIMHCKIVYPPQTAAVGLALVLIERYGRRILLFLSATVCCISMTLLGVYFYLEENMCLEGDNSCSSGMKPTLLW